MTTFGSVLRRARLAAGLTQRQLAERAGLSRAAIWRLEAERSRPAAEPTMAQLVKVLPELAGVDLGTLEPPAPRSEKGGSP
jgi:transcriptional regulator with XRE-family HTH domain